MFWHTDDFISFSVKFAQYFSVALKSYRSNESGYLPVGHSTARDFNRTFILNTVQRRHGGIIGQVEYLYELRVGYLDYSSCVLGQIDVHQLGFLNFSVSFMMLSRQKSCSTSGTYTFPGTITSPYAYFVTVLKGIKLKHIQSGLCLPSEN